MSTVWVQVDILTCSACMICKDYLEFCGNSIVSKSLLSTFDVICLSRLCVHAVKVESKREHAFTGKQSWERHLRLFQHYYAAQSAHCKIVLGLNPVWGLSVCSLHVLHVGSFQVLQCPPTIRRHAVSGVGLTGDSILLIGVSGCLYLCVSLATGWWPVQIVYPASWPVVAGIGSSPSLTLSWINGREWMGG